MFFKINDHLKEYVIIKKGQCSYKINNSENWQLFRQDNNASSNQLKIFSCLLYDFFIINIVFFIF